MKLRIARKVALHHDGYRQSTLAKSSKRLNVFSRLCRKWGETWSLAMDSGAYSYSSGDFGLPWRVDTNALLEAFSRMPKIAPKAFVMTAECWGKLAAEFIGITPESFSIAPLGGIPLHVAPTIEECKALALALTGEGYEVTLFHGEDLKPPTWAAPAPPDSTIRVHIDDMNNLILKSLSVPAHILYGEDSCERTKSLPLTEPSATGSPSVLVGGTVSAQASAATLSDA